MGNFISDNWGNIASVGGLVFSFLAFVFSKRASKAAKYARDLVLTRSLSEDMNEGNRTASEIAMYVAIGRDDIALLHSTELLNRTRFLLARWTLKLSKSSKDNLLTAREQLSSINQVLTSKRLVELESDEKTRLVQACQRVNELYSEEYGSAVKLTDDR